MQSTTATTTTLSTVPKVTWDSLQLGNLIGNGSFGDVYQGTWNGKAVAIKLLQMKTLTANLVTDFTKESQLMWDCQSDNTLSLYGICLDPGHCAMVTEYMGQGSLYNVINNQELSEEQCWQIALGMARGLSLIHSKDIIHRDFKSFNVLIDDHYQAKICDFGLAKLKTAIASGSTSNKKTGSVRWKAPELFKFKAVATKASDIYSFGMVLWELASKRLPFAEGSDDTTVMGWIKDGAQEDIPEDCSEAWRSIIKSCWATAELRPSAAEIVTQLEAAMPKPIQSVSEEKSWHFATKPDSSQIQGNYALLKGEQADYDKVQQYYQRYPVPGYFIQQVEVIYNPALNRSFSLKMSLLQERHNNSGFAPSWQAENDSDWRAIVHQSWQDMAAPYQDSDYPDVRLLPLWHGTNPAILDSIFRTGYANLATTDAGFFGKGLYSAYEAEYANRVYSKGALLLNWVASYSAYPVIHGDMNKLSSKGNYANYDAHFVPVAPANPNKLNESVYYPCAPHQKPTYTEVVVFDSSQCLPRYLVTLEATLKQFTPTTSFSDIIANQNTELADVEAETNKKAVTPLIFSASPQLSPKTPPKTPPKVPPKITASPKTIKQNQMNEERQAFLKLVVEGEQAKAELMLQQNAGLAIASGSVTDLSERSFNNITGFQYAVWALDWHMWEMIFRYMPVDAAREQIKRLKIADWTAEHGKSVSWQNLIEVLHDFVQLCEAGRQDEASNCWRVKVGNAQMLLPVHVVNEYCHPHHTFSDCPNFKDSVLPRNRRTDEGDWFLALSKGGACVGDCFAVYKRVTGFIHSGNGWDCTFKYRVQHDIGACRRLLDVRIEQRSQLFKTIENKLTIKKFGMQ